MVEYEDLTDEQQALFDEAMENFDAGVSTEAAQTAYVNGLARAVENNDYAQGLADRFGLEVDQIATADSWQEAVSDADAEMWAEAAQDAGVSEKFRDNFVVGITEATEA